MNNTTTGILLFIVAAFFITLFLWGCPQYHVYSERKNGEAQLAHAQYSREVAVAEAKAKMESASLLAIADTLRAIGVARANVIIGNSLRDNQAYLYWKFIDELKDTKDQIIYIPSGNLGMPLPITEAQRLSKPIVLQPTE